jgi:hypothetical protein
MCKDPNVSDDRCNDRLFVHIARSPTCEEQPLFRFLCHAGSGYQTPCTTDSCDQIPRSMRLKLDCMGESHKSPVSPNALQQCQLFRIPTCVSVETKELSYTCVHRRLGMLTAVEQWSRSALHKHKSSSSELCLKQPWLV